ncbi:MAG: trigger factor [bacterium]|nr:trigger factor [bacterium]
MAKITHAIAKSDDKTVQITFTIPYATVKEAQNKVVVDYAKTAEIAGFRKGKAPIEKVKEKIEPNTLIEKSLGLILPKALGEVITQDKLKPAIYPKFEVVKANTDEDWQVRATTCELPEVNLGDYKKIISQTSESHSAPADAKTMAGKEASRDKKEQEVIKTLLSTVKINIPTILVEEEVNSRLASLLERIEKLGLTLEGYLSSLKKKPEELRNEYETQAKNTISLDLVLNKISTDEKIQISEEQINDALKAVSADPKLFEKLNTPEQRLLIKGVLRRRGALDYLVALL